MTTTKDDDDLTLGAHFVIDELVVPGEVLLGLVYVRGGRLIEVVAVLLRCMGMLLGSVLLLVSGEILLLLMVQEAGGTVRWA